jgi:Tfp pilus assembly protein FimV
MAAEADALATAAHNPEMQAAYPELKRQWRVLADEIDLNMAPGARARITANWFLTVVRSTGRTLPESDARSGHRLQSA